MKLTKQGNFRVIVIPDKPRFGVTEGNWKTRCIDIVTAIQRHIDNVERVYRESNTLCVFCDNLYEVETKENDPYAPKGQPLCCDEAVKAFNDAQEGK